MKNFVSETKSGRRVQSGGCAIHCQDCSISQLCIPFTLNEHELDQLDNIIEMIYALDKIAPGTANDDTLLYGVEVKFYNMEVEIDENLESKHKGLYIIGDGSGVTHSLSHASASGVYVARKILGE